MAGLPPEPPPPPALTRTEREFVDGYPEVLERRSARVRLPPDGE
jgi:hypothetical protein